MKRKHQNVLQTVGASGANVYTSDTAREIIFCADNSADPLVTLLDPIPYGGILNYETFASQAEVRQIALIGASTTKETIVASQKYSVKINNQTQLDETRLGKLSIHSYTAPAVLSGTAATDRAAVYVALAAKINAYYKNYVTAYTLTRVDFTGGTSTGNAATTFIIGETVTQETSTETAKVAKCSITSGTMADDNAAGVLWLYDISDVSAWLETAKTLTAAGTVAGVSTNIVVTATNATTVHNTGLVLRDDAGYFTSDLERGGISNTYLEGFATDTVEVALVGKYSMGIGTDMLALKPVYDRDGRDVISGDPNFDFPTAPTAGTTYTKIVLHCKGTNKEAMGQMIESLPYEVIIYANESSSANLTALTGAITTAMAKK